MSESRKASAKIIYYGKNLKSGLNDCIKGFTFTDVASGSDDSISLELHNIDKNWIGKWMPVKGDIIRANIEIQNWTNSKISSFLCGKFSVDQIAFSGRPLEAEIEAVSSPIRQSFKVTDRNKTWKSATIKDMAEKIAKVAGLKLSYDAKTIKIKKIEQSSNDCDFLYSTCETYGLGMKIYSDTLVIFDEAKYEKKKAILTLNETDMTSWSYETSIAGTYTGGKIQYTDGKKDKEITVIVGDGNRILSINESADDVIDAELKALAKVNEANKNVTTLNIEMPGNPRVIATGVINITGLEKVNGRYYVNRVIHTVGNGYTMSLELRKIQRRIGDKAESSGSSGGNYTVRGGESLWIISKKLLGSGEKYMQLYNFNKDVIESTAKKRGKSSSENGKWLFAGTVLNIPK